MKQIFKSRERLWVSLFIIAFAILLVMPQLFTRKVILGSDSIFHYNRFYEAAMQLKNGNFSYFLSLYGFQQSGRIVNALYGPFFAYLQGGLILISGTWFRYQIVSRVLLHILAESSMYALLTLCNNILYSILDDASGVLKLGSSFTTFLFYSSNSLCLLSKGRTS